MEPITLILLGIGAYVLYIANLGRSLTNLTFFPGNITGFTFEQSTPVIYTQLIVQNTSNAQITIYSLAANVTANGSLVGNLSDFVPVTINPNSQGAVPIKISFNIVGAVSDLINAFTNHTREQNLVVDGYANTNGIQVPVQLTYKLG
jgi:LEA14-like dessication related protein